MKRLLILFSILLYPFFTANAQYEGPVPPIDTGYGSDGPHGESVVTFPSPLWPAEDVTITYPSDLTTPVPTIFFSHAWGLTDPAVYAELLDHIASWEYAVVFSPYKTTGASFAERYNILFEGFKTAVQDYPHILDSSRCGFVGHSFGGGATPEMAHRGLVDNGWGTNGNFMFIMAPWYVLEISQNELQDFPSDTKLLIQLYDDDEANDHRMGIDIFESIAIPDESKDCVFVSPDSVSGYPYLADHSLPTQYSNNPGSAFNAYDYYAVFRLFDALADYTFTGNLDAKNIALGNGSPEQLDMGPQLKPLYESDNPIPQYPYSAYMYPWDSPLNPRTSYYHFIVPDIKVDGEDGPLTIPSTQAIDLTVSLYPGDQEGVAHDWWVGAILDETYVFCWNYPNLWYPYLIRCYDGPLVDLTDIVIHQGTIPVGTWEFFFTVDTLNNTYEGTYFDSIDVVTVF